MVQTHSHEQTHANRFLCAPAIKGTHLIGLSGEDTCSLIIGAPRAQSAQPPASAPFQSGPHCPALGLGRGSGPSSNIQSVARGRARSAGTGSAVGLWPRSVKVHRVWVQGSRLIGNRGQKSVRFKISSLDPLTGVSPSHTYCLSCCWWESDSRSSRCMHGPLCWWRVVGGQVGARPGR